MKQIELKDNEVYFIAYQMKKLWQDHDNKYAKSIYDKAKVLLDEMIEDMYPETDFLKEYECTWIK